MFQGKRKAITFSFDDGVTQDRRLIALLDKYGMKASFPLNSSSLGRGGRIEYGGFHASHDKVNPEEVISLYQNHEILVHTVHHPDLLTCDETTIIHEVEDDRFSLEQLTGKPIVGMAYPFGTYDERVVKTLHEKTQIGFSRTIWATFDFRLPENWLMWRPTVHALDFDHLFDLAEAFIRLDTNEDALFYIWGHAYEFDFENSWERFESFLKIIAFKTDIYYGTNGDVYRCLTKTGV